VALNKTTYEIQGLAARRDIRTTLAGLSVAMLAAGGVALERGFRLDIRPDWMMPVLQIVASYLALWVAGDLGPLAGPKTRWRSRVGQLGELGLLAAVAIEAAGFSMAGEIVAVAMAVTLACRLNTQLARTISNPSLLFPGSFVVLILLSTTLLMLPAATPQDNRIGLVDALFTATSAVCVTGLTVRDTGGDFTLFGQSVIFASIQLGGLGMMIFGSTLALLFGARLSFRENLTLSRALNEYPAHRISRFVGFIVLTTVFIEAAGAVAIYALWPAPADMAWQARAWMAAFHSVSAFCNAGFDLTGESMVGMRSSPVAYLGVMPLIIIGGVGFLVLDDLWRKAFGRATAGGGAVAIGDTGPGPRRRLSTHSKLVLVTTGLLLVGGALVIFAAQLKVPGVAPGQRVLDAVFMSTTARTAGFNSVPMEELAPGSRFMLMVLMLIGGSPGSTAGGIKTVVFAVLALGVFATVRGRDEVEVFGRALPDELVKKAAAAAFGLITLVALATLTLDLIEQIPFEPLFFEVISAASTTGLSLGITERLSPAARLVLVAAMFLGRVGLLAFIGSLIAGGGRRGSYRYPRDNVSLG
jgi:trk system potassium uptake protein TrkH